MFLIIDVLWSPKISLMLLEAYLTFIQRFACPCTYLDNCLSFKGEKNCSIAADCHFQSTLRLKYGWLFFFFSDYFVILIQSEMLYTNLV